MVTQGTDPWCVDPGCDGVCGSQVCCACEFKVWGVWNQGVWGAWVRGLQRYAYCCLEGSSVHALKPPSNAVQVARRTGLRVCVSETKMSVLRCLGVPEQQLLDTFTTDPAETPVHVVGV